MKTKLFKHNILYEKGEDFFLLKGNACMKLTPNAAIENIKEDEAAGYTAFIVTISK